MPIYNLDYVDYWIDLNIPADINFSFNRISEHNIFDLDGYINTLSIQDDQTLIILWGFGARIPISDQLMGKLNTFYHNIKNPMLLFSSGNFQSSLLDFPHLQFNFFQYVSKNCFYKFNQNLNITNVDKNKKFMFASTKDYLSRRYILQTIITGGFEADGYIGYKCIHTNLNSEIYNTSESDHIAQAGKSIESKLPILGIDNSIEFIHLPRNIINDCYLSLITDTYYISDTVYLSEKIFNAMIYRHFFIYLGPAHSLKYLQSLGFRTFSHIIDESYDDIEDPADRLYAVSHSINQFLSKPLSEIKQLYIENLNIINHNRNLVLSTEINDTIVSAMRSAIAIKN